MHRHEHTGMFSLGANTNMSQSSDIDKRGCITLNRGDRITYLNTYHITNILQQNIGRSENTWVFFTDILFLQETNSNFEVQKEALAVNMSQGQVVDVIQETENVWICTACMPFIPYNPRQLRMKIQNTSQKYPNTYSKSIQILILTYISIKEHPLPEQHRMGRSSRMLTSGTASNNIEIGSRGS